METDVIYLGDCIEVMKKLPNASVDLVATDPPFNIGLKYDLYEDKKDYKAYLAWSREWLTQCHRVLKDNGSIFLCIGDEYQAEINVLLKELGFFWRNTVVWYYTFGENQRKKFNRTHTLIHYFTKSPTVWKFYPDAIKVPSARQVKYKDSRAKSGGKLPDDVWESIFLKDPSPSAIPENVWDAAEAELEGTEEYAAEWQRQLDGLDMMPGGAQGATPYMTDWIEEQIRSTASHPVPDDVWKISRVCGSFKERIKEDDGSAHPCQMPQSVMDRIIKCSTEPGDVVLDPFCGTGTTADAAKSLGRKFITIDMSKSYAGVAAKRIFGKKTAYKVV